jgi:hypothetical protein
MLDNYRDLIDELLGTPSTLRQLLDQNGAAVSPAAGTLLVELRRRDETVRAHLQEMTRRNDAYLRAPSPASVDESDVRTELAAFDTARGELVSLLMNLTLRDWERTAIHETEGEIRLVELVEQHVDFDEEQVRRLRQELA